MARPWSLAHWSSASALVPFMSDLKPPSQSNPGVAPSRWRTAMRRAALPVPTCRNFRQRSSIWVSRLAGKTGIAGRAAAVFRRMLRRMQARPPAKGMGSVSNGSSDTHVPPRTLAGATILQIVPALRESPVARTAVNVAHALLQSGARALIAADDGPLVAELKAFGGEWVPLVNATVNPFKLRRSARTLEQLIASERVDIVHAQSIGGAWSANMAAAQIAVWLVTTLPDAPAVSGIGAYWAGALARGDRVITPSNFAAAPVMARYG